MAFDVSVPDVESRWRALSDDEADVALVRLGDADRLLRARRPGLEAFYAGLPAGGPQEDLLETIRQVLADAVIRFLRNPDLVSQQQIQADGGVGIGFDTRNLGGVYLSPADLATIDQAVGAAEGVLRPHVGSQALVSSFPYRTRTPGPWPLPTP